MLETFQDRAWVEDEEIKAEADRLVMEVRHEACLTAMDREALKRHLFDSMRGLDVLQELIEDDEVTEIMVNGPDHIFVEKAGQICSWQKHFESREKLEDVIQRIVGDCNRVINERTPIADARLPDGSRVNAVIAPAAINGPILTIRRFPKERITMADLIRYGSVTKEAADDLKRYVRSGYSILISGGTSAGKTTFLNALSNAIPKGERVITIEDNAELQIQGVANLVSLEAKSANMEGNKAVTIRDLIKSSLRMRPDRVVVGEVRGEEAAELLQALNTGHTGSFSTIHANSAADTLNRFETLVMFAMDIPAEAIRRQIASGIDLVVYLGRVPNKGRRVMEIVELDGLENGVVRTNPLYMWDNEAGSLKCVGQLRHRDKLILAGEG
ncbi:MAG: CpaF family protein [Lachnospiraceae bacterium]|nr:CpaF family protein [Candidatus Equihabitans merdae]